MYVVFQIHLLSLHLLPVCCLQQIECNDPECREAHWSLQVGWLVGSMLVLW